eukprot:Opistho-1_new@48197
MDAPAVAVVARIRVGPGRRNQRLRLTDQLPGMRRPKLPPSSHWRPRSTGLRSLVSGKADVLREHVTRFRHGHRTGDEVVHAELQAPVAIGGCGAARRHGEKRRPTTEGKRRHLRNRVARRQQALGGAVGVANVDQRGVVCHGVLHGVLHHTRRLVARQCAGHDATEPFEQIRAYERPPRPLVLHEEYARSLRRTHHFDDAVHFRALRIPRPRARSDWRSSLRRVVARQGHGVEHKLCRRCCRRRLLARRAHSRTLRLLRLRDGRGHGRIELGGEEEAVEGEGEFDPERRALPDVADDANAATHEFGEALAYRKAESSPSERAR